MNDLDGKIRAYVHSLPGATWGASEPDVIDQVRSACGAVDAGLDEVRKCLWRYGYVPQSNGLRMFLSFPVGPLKPIAS